MPIKLPLKDGTDWEMPIQFETVLRENYYEVPDEMRKASIWLMANPQRRPTLRGVRTFCVNWLNRGKKLKPSTEPAQQSLSIKRAEETVIDFEAGKARLQELRKMIKRVA